MNKKIGMIDSGLGGISVLNACLQAYPHHDYVFIGDQLHAPYGERSVEELHGYVNEMLEFFRSQDIHEVIIACNTICALLLDELVLEHPDFKLHGIIEATVKQLSASLHHVLVLATRATTASHAYPSCIHKYYPDMLVDAHEASKLVPLIENGGSEAQLKKALHEYLDPYLGKIDALLLGCTHYPLLISLIQEISDVTIYDSNQAVIESLPFTNAYSDGSLRIYTSGSPSIMHRQIHDILDKDYEVHKFCAKP